MRFQDRVVIVTGGAKGIGAGCVRVFHAEGGHVAIFDRDRDSAVALADELTSNGPGEVTVAYFDVTDAEQFQKQIRSVVDHFGRIDCLINNAGVHPPATSIDGHVA